MSIEQQHFPQFFITSEGECPYLPGRRERKIFTHLVGMDAADLNDVLTRTGFRRSQNIAYRPACEGCNACTSVRIPVCCFRPDRTQRRIIRRNADLVVEACPPRVTAEAYHLFRQYITARHGDGSMAEMTIMDFTAMVEETFVESRLITYRRRLDTEEGPAGELLACCLTDIHDDGLSMIYSFYHPGLPKRSLGSYMILEHVHRASLMGLEYVYLGYWVPGSPKMGYKERFLPQERLVDDEWVMVDRPRKLQQAG